MAQVTPGGVRLNLSGIDLVIPALSLRQVRQVTESGLLQRLHENLGRPGVPSTEMQDGVIDLTLMAFARSERPEVKAITRDDLLDLVDTGNLAELFMAVVNGAGLVKVKPGEAVGPKS